MPKYIEISEDEAWSLDHLIRHTYVDGPTNVGKALLLKAMNTVLEFEDRRSKPLSPQTLPLALTEEECWAIDHQIRCDLTVNGKPVGRTLLLKVFRLLTEYANERESQVGVDELGYLEDMLRHRPPAKAPPDETPRPPDRPDSDGPLDQAPPREK